MVAIGVTVALWAYSFILDLLKRDLKIHTMVSSFFSLLPPSTTLRRYIRTTYATTTSQIGQLYCDILSLATVRDNVKTEEIVQNLVAVRMKLNRTRLLRRNVDGL